MDAGESAEEELSTEECMSLIDEMKEMGTEMLILTGGEPLLRRDIYEIAAKASSLGMWVVMGTNGVLVNEHVAQKMVACGVKGVGISIDSVDADKHNAFRGGPNAWKYSVRALEICHEHGLEVLVQASIMEENREELRDLIAFARDKNAWSFNLYFLVKTGRGMELSDLSAEETESCIREMIELQGEFEPMFIRAKCAPQFKQISYEMGRGGLESGGCMAGTEYCRITPEGNVTPCPYMDVVAGNVRTSGFKDVWKRSEVLLNLRDTYKLKGRCGACEFKELCGGCRCRAYSATGDYMAEDPACTYQPGTMAAPSMRDVVFSDPVAARLEKIPIDFIRGKVKKGLIAYASRHGLRIITESDMDKAMAGASKRSFAKLAGSSLFKPPMPDS